MAACKKNITWALLCFLVSFFCGTQLNAQTIRRIDPNTIQVLAPKGPLPRQHFIGVAPQDLYLSTIRSFYKDEKKLFIAVAKPTSIPEKDVISVFLEPDEQLVVVEKCQENDPKIPETIYSYANFRVLKAKSSSPVLSEKWGLSPCDLVHRIARSQFVGNERCRRWDVPTAEIKKLPLTNLQLERELAYQLEVLSSQRRVSVNGLPRLLLPRSDEAGRRSFREFAMNYLRDLGFKVTEVPYRSQSYEGVSFYATLAGSGRNYLMLTTSYDVPSVSSALHYDQLNSGPAVLLALAKAFAGKKLETGLTLVFNDQGAEGEMGASVMRLVISNYVICETVVGAIAVGELGLSSTEKTELTLFQNSESKFSLLSHLFEKLASYDANTEIQNSDFNYGSLSYLRELTGHAFAISGARAPLCKPSTKSLCKNSLNFNRKHLFRTANLLYGLTDIVLMNYYMDIPMNGAKLKTVNTFYGTF